MGVAGKYVRIILSPNLVIFSCIWILYRGLDAWPINTEIPGMTLLFVEKGMSNSMVFHCISKLIFDNLLWAWGAQTHPGTAGCQISILIIEI
jgi:hypothetical protein